MNSSKIHRLDLPRISSRVRTKSAAQRSGRGISAAHWAGPGSRLATSAALINFMLEQCRETAPTLATGSRRGISIWKSARHAGLRAPGRLSGAGYFFASKKNVPYAFFLVERFQFIFILWWVEKVSYETFILKVHFLTVFFWVFVRIWSEYEDDALLETLHKLLSKEPGRNEMLTFYLLNYLKTNQTARHTPLHYCALIRTWTQGVGVAPSKLNCLSHAELYEYPQF